jgi:hypothetical protein
MKIQMIINFFDNITKAKKMLRKAGLPLPQSNIEIWFNSQKN